MITAITFHAIKRLSERRNLTHLERHINKIQKWNLPPDGITDHKGYRYVTREGVLITVLPPNRKRMKEIIDERVSRAGN